MSKMKNMLNFFLHICTDSFFLLIERKAYIFKLHLTTTSFRADTETLNKTRNSFTSKKLNTKFLPSKVLLKMKE